MRILVSACLLGLPTRYDGAHRLHEQVLALAKRHEIVPVCPEQLGGLPTPRLPCERLFDRVVDSEGKDHTAAFTRGAQMAAQVYTLSGCQAALLKAKSPSCGKGQIYDGSFSGQLTKGHGVLAELLLGMSQAVYDEQEIHRIE